MGAQGRSALWPGPASRGEARIITMMSTGADKTLSAQSRYKIVMAVFACTALIVAASSLTHEIHLVENYDEMVAPLDAEAVMEKDYMLEDVDTDPTAGDEDTRSELLQPLVKPLEELLEVQDSEETVSTDESPLDRLGSAITRLTAAQESLAKDDKAKAKAKVKGDAKASPESVKKALKDAANAKIQAMSAQQKALSASAIAKQAAATAAQAPMTQAGQAVVKKAQRMVAKARLDVDTAKAAMSNLARQKAIAAKAIVDAAGGKYGGSASYAGQGGYFGAALKTAFKNGELTERLKYQKFKSSTLKNAKTKAFKEGEEKGIEEGMKKGMKKGEKKELPKAVAKAEQMLAQKKKAERKEAEATKKAAANAALKDEAKREASKVRAAVAKEAKKAEKASEIVEVDDVMMELEEDSDSESDWDEGDDDA